MFDFDHEPHTIKYFQKELTEITNSEMELKELEESFKERDREFKKIISKIVVT